MESFQVSLDEVKELFSAKMAEFQADLSKAAPNSSSATTLASLNADFANFKKLITGTLNNLQQQVELLAQECDRLEMRSRRKILLVHGIPEAPNEDPSQTFIRAVVERMKLPLDLNSFSRSQRLGRTSNEKPRPILLKFSRTELRDQVWYAKSTLKGSGVTLSEFLTRGRHSTFLEARKRLGITRSWTRSGVIVVAASDGHQHRITTLSELNKVCPPAASTPAVRTSPVREVSGSGRSKRSKR